MKLSVANIAGNFEVVIKSPVMLLTVEILKIGNLNLHYIYMSYIFIEHSSQMK